MDIVKARARTMKRWQTRDMRLWWAVTGILCAEMEYRWLVGFRELGGFEEPG